MTRRKLPHLDGLIFFEAAARSLSFTRAAEELLVSQAAVSKRISQLEEWLGQQLFLRENRNLRLTEAGIRLYDTAHLALDYLERGIETVALRTDTPVRVASNIAVSLFWLMPRLKAFSLTPESVPLQTVTSERREDLLRDDVDIAIVYGRADAEFPGWTGRILSEEVLAPVASPAVAHAAEAALRTGNATRFSLLNYRRIGPDWVNWDTWIAETGAADFLPLPKVQCTTYAQSIGDAIAGKGIALGSLPLIRAEIDRERLAQVGQRQLRRPHGYHLLSRHQPTPETPLDRLLKFLSVGLPPA